LSRPAGTTGLLGYKKTNGNKKFKRNKHQKKPPPWRKKKKLGTLKGNGCEQVLIGKS